MDDNLERRVVTELKNLSAGSVFSVQDISVALSKKQLLSFLSPYLDQGEVSRVVPNIYYKLNSQIILIRREHLGQLLKHKKLIGMRRLNHSCKGLRIRLMSG